MCAKLTLLKSLSREMSDLTNVQYQIVHSGIEVNGCDSTVTFKQEPAFILHNVTCMITKMKLKPPVGSDTSQCLYRLLFMMWIVILLTDLIK